MADDVRALKDKAAEQTRKGKLGAALATWREVAKLTPADIASAQKVAELLVRLGQRGEAVAAYEDVAKRFADSGQFFKASAVCRIILDLEPGNTRTRDRLATMYAAAKPAQPLAKTAPPPSAEVPIEVSAPDAGVLDELEIVIEEEPVTASGQPPVPLFSSLTEEELQAVLGSAMQVRQFSDGDVLVTEGAPGSSMFAVAEGTAGIWRGWGTAEARQVADVSAGDIFGELALVSGAPRLATVVAKGDVQVLELSRDAMHEIGTRFPRVRMLVDAFSRDRLLANAFRASPIFRALPDAEREALAASFEARAFTAGQRIVLEGHRLDSVHLLLRGTCTVKHQSGQRYPDLREGDLFGEVSVLTDGPATATVAAAGTVVTLRIPADAFKARVLANPEAAAAVNQLAAARLGRTADLDARTRTGDRRV